ncbi:MAG: polysaccharide biosynthesis tyrosine autokinase, partial [Oricola sp.]|nr:polysaccharide biosynthesis tyrosine autokinase [Oricola sp.]
TASALIMLDSRSTLLDETESMFAGLPIADTYIESEIELIRSDAIVHQVIEQENLLEDPEFAGGNVPAGIRQILEARENDPEGEGSEELLKSVQLLQTSKEVRKRLNVQRRGLSQGVEVSFRSRSQEKARDLANAFAQTYVNDQLDNKLSASTRAMDWLRAELQILSQETQIAEAKVEEYRSQNTLVGEGDQGVGMQQMRLLNEKLTAARAEEALAEVKAGQLRELRANRESLLMLPEISENKQIQALRDELIKAEQAEAEMANLYNPDRRDQIPPYQEAYTRRLAVEAALNKETGRVAREIETRLASAKAVTRSLEAELQSLRNKNADVNAATIGLNELEREAAGKRERYESLLDEYNETNNTAAVQTPHARIVSPAELPLTPSAPRKKAAFGAAVIFAGALGVFIALLREFTRRSIRTPAELLALLNLRPIGVLPKAPKPFGKRKKDLAVTMNLLTKAPESDYAEAVRSLRAELFLVSGYNNSTVVAVTSPDEVKGKVAMAGSLARSIALTGAKVLFVDADVRRANVLPRLFKDYDGPDLASVLRGQADWRDAVVVARNKRLSLIGARPGGWDEVVSHAFSGRFQRLVDAWREEYQVVVINAPPSCAYPETRAISAYADNVLLALQWNATNRRRVGEAIDLLREVDCVPHIVMTDVAKGSYRRWFRAGPPRQTEKAQLKVVPIN